MESLVQLRNNLKNKSLDDLIMILLNFKNYVESYEESKKNENTNLITQLSYKTDELKEIKQKSNQLKGNLEEILNQLNEISLKSDNVYNNSNTIKNIMSELKEDKEKEYKETKRQLLNQLQTNSISFDDLKVQLEKLSETYYYYTDLVEVVINNLNRI